MKNLLNLSGKVLVIGNAESVLEEKRDLSGYNIVRMNEGFPKGKEEYIGSRTDCLCTSKVLSPDTIKKEYGDPMLMWMTPNHQETWKISRYKKFYEDNAYFYPKERWEVLKKRLGKRPTTGVMVIDTFAGYLNCKVDILGFDWLETDSWYWKRHRRPKAEKMYNWEAEKEFILNHRNVINVCS